MNMSPANIKRRFPCQGITIHKKYKYVRSKPTPDAPSYQTGRYIPGYRIKSSPDTEKLTKLSEQNGVRKPWYINYHCITPNLDLITE